VGRCAGKTLKGEACKRKVGAGSRFCCKHAEPKIQASEGASSTVTPDGLKPAKSFYGKRTVYTSPHFEFVEEGGKVVRLELPWIDVTTHERGSTWVTPAQIEAWPDVDERHRVWLDDWAAQGKLEGKTSRALNTGEASDAADIGHGGFRNRQCAPLRISCEACDHNLGGLRMAQCSGAHRCFRALHHSEASQVLAASFTRGVQWGPLPITRRGGEFRCWCCCWCLPPWCRVRF
jgi:hypothetical protein